MPEKDVVASSLSHWEFILGLAGSALSLVYIGGRVIRGFEAKNEHLQTELNLAVKRILTLEQAQYITMPHHDNLQRICQQDIKSLISDETHTLIVSNQQTVNDIKLDMQEIKSDVRIICKAIEEMDP